MGAGSAWPEVAAVGTTRTSRCGWSGRVGAADRITGALVGETVLQPNGQTFASSLSRTSAAPVWPARVRLHRGGRAAGGRGACGFADPGDGPAGHGAQFEHGLPRGVQRRDSTTCSATLDLAQAYDMLRATKQRRLLETSPRTLGLNGEGRTGLRPSRATTTRPASARPEVHQNHPRCRSQREASRRGRPAPGPSPPACPGQRAGPVFVAEDRGGRRRARGRRLSLVRGDSAAAASP